MKKLILTLGLPLILIIAGCTIDDPGYVIIDDSTPVDVAVTGNPEVKVVDDDGDIITIDSASGALTAIAYEHHVIHSGDSFQCWYEQLVTDIGDKTIIAFRTDNTTQWLHLVPKATSTVMAEAYILESPAIVDNTGATLAVYNRDRNTATTSTIWDTSSNPDLQGSATFFTLVTMGNVTGGTEIGHLHIGTGSGPKTTGGGDRATEEWILKQNTLYAFIVESLNADDNYHNIELNWYEHTNKD